MPDPTPEISQEAARAMLAALRECAEYVGDEPEAAGYASVQNAVVRDTREAAADAWEGYRARHGPQPGEGCVARAVEE